MQASPEQHEGKLSRAQQRSGQGVSLELDGELHAFVQLVEAAGSVCEAAHVQHQDLGQAQQLDLLLGCHRSAVITCFVVCIALIVFAALYFVVNEQV